ncbi:MAG: hypothetical protein NXI24_17295 [bacterium]|nr:hypothetical protein [bacterium]
MAVPPGITLELNPTQYRQLILMSYLGAAVVQTARDELSSESETGESVELPAGLEEAADSAPDLLQLILSRAVSTPEVEQDEGGELVPGEELESLAVDCADVYGETVFWNRLAEGLAERDLGQLRAQNRPLPEEMEEAELLQNLMEMYLEEFAENGLDNIMIPLLDENEMSHPN